MNIMQCRERGDLIYDTLITYEITLTFDRNNVIIISRIICNRQKERESERVKEECRVLKHIRIKKRG